MRTGILGLALVVLLCQSQSLTAEAAADHATLHESGETTETISGNRMAIACTNSSNWLPWQLGAFKRLFSTRNVNFTVTPTLETEKCSSFESKVYLGDDPHSLERQSRVWYYSLYRSLMYLVFQDKVYRVSPFGQQCVGVLIESEDSGCKNFHIRYKTEVNW